MNNIGRNKVTIGQARFYNNCLRKQWYEGDGGDGRDGGDGGSGDGGANNQTFTQEQVNKILANDRRKHEAKIQQTLNDLKTIQNSKNATDQELQEAQQRLTDLENSLKTKEQLEKEAKERFDKSIKDKDDEINRWKNLHTDATISREITDAAVQHEAFNPSQIVALLKPNTRLTEVVGEDGKPTGRLESRVKYTDKDKKGNPVELELSPAEAVKRMSETIDLYGNLFKGKAKGGAGDQNSGRAGSGQPPSGDQAAFREYYKSDIKGKQ